MLNRKGNIVFNKGKQIKEFDNEESAELFMNALSSYYGEETEEQFEKKQNKLYTSINEFKQHLNDNRD